MKCSVVFAISLTSLVLASAVLALAQTQAKKPYPYISTKTADLWDVISVSAGIRGLQMLVAPDDLVRVEGATKVAIAD